MNDLVPAPGSQLPIWPGTAPGSEGWTWSEQVLPTPDGRLARNIAVPTLEAFPPAAAPTGQAVIVAPGGAWTFLMLDKEGADLARRLAARGSWAFVLRYRVQPTPADDAGFAAFNEALWGRIHAGRAGDDPFAMLGPGGADAARMSFDDGRRAVRMVREHAPDWGIDAGRVGFVGFSAGAGVVLAAATAPDPAERPDFAAPIYGLRIADPVPVPNDAPPLFLACAADDDAIPPTESIAIWNAWRATGQAAELHVFASGGHGFGLKHTGKPSDAWVDLFERWLDGLTPTDR
jgi:acetyl esterase/lipase